jgi:hypothetical protein
MGIKTRLNKDRYFSYVFQAYAVLLLLLALVIFIATYGIEGGSSTRPYEFYRTFFIFFLFYSLCIVLLSHTRHLLGILLLCFLGLTALLVLDYSLNDYLTIRLLLYLAFQTVILSLITWPYDLPFPLLYTLTALYFQLLPPFLGENDLNAQLRPIQTEELIAFSAILLCFCLPADCSKALLCTARKSQGPDRDPQYHHHKTDHFQPEPAIVRPNSGDGSGEEGTIPDLAGDPRYQRYMFTNIIAMMDAIIATGCRNSDKTSEMCSAARSQAQEGLVETRRALHLLRKSDSEREVGMRAIYKIKKIFESTTGVKVEIESEILRHPSVMSWILFSTHRAGRPDKCPPARPRHCVRILFWIVDGSVQVIILDNGTGAKKIIKGIGLAGMEERISRLGGVVRAENAPEGGFQLL